MAKPNVNETVGGLHPLEMRLLRALKGHATGIESETAADANLSPAQFRRAVEWLLTKKLVALLHDSREEAVRATELGEKYREGGIPEDRIASELRAKGEIAMSDFNKMEGLGAEETFPAIGALKKKGILVVEKGVARIKEGADLSTAGEASAILERVCSGERVLLSALSEEQAACVKAQVHKRFRAKGIFWIEEETTRAFRLTEEGAAVADEVERRGLTGEEESKLTPEMLADGSWRGKAFRRYNIELAPPRRVAARKHPYREFLDYVKYKLVSMGFEEMKGPLVESEFWNMDALFMPQFHSARDIHDAYFIKEPTHAGEVGGEFLDKVAASHENGGETSSRGWRYDFDYERTKRLVLRSQSTSLSARTLAASPKIPGKYFALGRCFRYDTVDATHGAEFIQSEGIVLDNEINFKTLLGLLKLFATEVAKVDEVLFAPAYFPFTEPSVEAHIRHPVLGWMEMGGAGIFRPELTAPFGIDVPVLAWGLGLDRMAMTALGISDIRDLFSRDLDRLRTRRIDFKMV